MLKLTREQAIAEHRKMWNWLADQYESGIFLPNIPTKWEYFINFKREEEVPRNLCYCCEYAYSTYGGCDNCPLQWPDDLDCRNRNSLFEKYNICVDKVEHVPGYHAEDDLVKYARQIANLPEKEVENDSE